MIGGSWWRNERHFCFDVMFCNISHAMKCEWRHRWMFVGWVFLVHCKITTATTTTNRKKGSMEIERTRLHKLMCSLYYIKFCKFRKAKLMRGWSRVGKNNAFSIYTTALKVIKACNDVSMQKKPSPLFYFIFHAFFHSHTPYSLYPFHCIPYEPLHSFSSTTFFYVI